VEKVAFFKFFRLHLDLDFAFEKTFGLCLDLDSRCERILIFQLLIHIRKLLAYSYPILIREFLKFASDIHPYLNAILAKYETNRQWL